MGEMKWKVDKLTGSTLELKDSSGNKVAKLKSGGGHGEKKLDILIPCDAFFVELVMLSGIAAKTISKIMTDIAIEVAGGWMELISRFVHVALGGVHILKFD